MITEEAAIAFRLVTGSMIEELITVSTTKRHDFGIRVKA
jgi:hypothetical protein